MKILNQFQRAGARVLAVSAVLGTGMAATAQAQGVGDYPNRPIEIVVPFAAGGSAELSARVIQSAMESALGQPIIIVNRPGAATNIGNLAVVHAPADGYTLLMGATALAANPALYPNLGFDPLTDLVPITVVTNSPLMIAAHPSLPANNAQELIAYAAANPGVLNYASSGIGSSAHLNGELFNLVAGVDIQHVSYTGGGPAMLAVTSGEVELISSNVANLRGLIEGGQVKPIGVSGTERSSQLPDVPTFYEQGVDFELGSWFGLLAPAGTPEPIVELLAETVRTILADPAIIASIEGHGAIAVGNSPEEFAELLRTQTESLGAVIRAAGITAE